jgi:hypothetical protein
MIRLTLTILDGALALPPRGSGCDLHGDTTVHRHVSALGDVGAAG